MEIIAGLMNETALLRVHKLVADRLVCRLRHRAEFAPDIGKECLDLILDINQKALARGESINAPVTLISSDEEGPIACAVGVPMTWNAFRALLEHHLPVDPMIIDRQSLLSGRTPDNEVDPAELFIVVVESKNAGKEETLGRAIASSLRRWPARPETRISILINVTRNSVANHLAELFVSGEINLLTLFPDIIVSKPAYFRAVADKFAGYIH